MIPKDEEVEYALREVLKKHKEVASQKHLKALTLGMLKKRNQFYMLSAKRARRIAANTNGVKIRVEKRRSKKDARVCYVCGGKLRSVKTKNLYGKEVIVGKRCTKCRFKIDKKLMPKRYIFVRDF